MTDLTSTPNTTLQNEWFFITCVLLLAAIAFLRVHFGRGLFLISHAAFTQRQANQFLRESNNLNVSPYLLPIFVIVFTLFVAHPSWNQTTWSILVILNYRIWLNENGYDHYLEINKMHAEKKNVVDSMSKQNDETKLNIDDLRQSTNLLDYLARNDLGLVAPGETYYQFKD